MALPWQERYEDTHDPRGNRFGPVPEPNPELQRLLRGGAPCGGKTASTMREEECKRGIGGAPTRATTLPTDSAGRKQFPVASGVLDYFPDALVALAELSFIATQQHHPDQPMHWDRAKSKDEADTAMRHFLQRGTLDLDGKRHTAKFAWRALALLQKEIEAEQEKQ